MGALIVFMVFFVLLVGNQNLGDNYRQWQSYYDSLEINISYFNGNLLRKQKYKQTYDNLNAQEGCIASLQNGEVLESPQTYLESSLNLFQTMLDGYQNNYLGASTLNVPPKYQLRQGLVTYKYLYQHHIPAAMSSKVSVTYLIYIVNFIAVLIFFYILLIANDVWMVKLDHETVLRNIPYRVEDEVKGKTMINLVLTLVPLNIGLIGAYLFAGLLNGFCSLNYPNVFYFNKIRAIPIWLDCLIFLFYTAVLVVFVTSLTLLLNQLTKNVYLSTFIGIALYVLSYLPSKLLKAIIWLPSVYLNVNDVLNGTVASKTGFAGLNFATAAIILLIWSLVCVVWFRYLVNKKGAAR